MPNKIALDICRIKISGWKRAKAANPMPPSQNNFYSRSRNNRVEERYVEDLPRGVLRAGLGITEESDAVAVICLRRDGRHFHLPSAAN